MIFNREEWSKRPTDPLDLRLIEDVIYTSKPRIKYYADWTKLLMGHG